MYYRMPYQYNLYQYREGICQYCEMCQFCNSQRNSIINYERVQSMNLHRSEPTASEKPNMNVALFMLNATKEDFRNKYFKNLDSLKVDYNITDEELNNIKQIDLSKLNIVAESQDFEPILDILTTGIHTQDSHRDNGVHTESTHNRDLLTGPTDIRPIDLNGLFDKYIQPMPFE